MSRIPSPSLKSKTNIASPKLSSEYNKVVFSFEALDKNEYFNLDVTCEKWSNDLFETMKIVSNIDVQEIYNGKYSKSGSPLRIHQHANASAPCKIPNSLSLDDFWQIRISASKGGIHGRFVENVFYVIWFDPHHNLYPNKNFGGLKKITPISSCCKERDEELECLQIELKKAKEDIDFLEKYVQEIERRSILNN